MIYDGPRCHRCEERSWNCRCPSVTQVVIETIIVIAIILVAASFIGV